MRKNHPMRSTARGGFVFRGRLGLHGQPMRDEQGHGDDTGGGGNQPQQQTTQQPNGNNQPGNSGGEGGPRSSRDNTGNQFDHSAFWNSPPEGERPASGNRGSAGNESQSGGHQQQQQNEGQAFVQRLQGLNFGGDIFSREAIDGMNEGNPEAFHTNMNQFGRESVRQSVLMSAELIQRAMQGMESRFEEILEARFGQDKAESDLGKSFPSYSNPAVRPVIDGIFAQSMKHTKGDRAKAIEMTRDMLKFTGTQVGQDLGITTPPGGPGNDGGPTTDWEEELLGR